MKREYMESEVTPWFEGTLFPARKGVYQRRYPLTEAVLFAYWDGAEWHNAAWSPMAARRDKGISKSRHLDWRGLREPAKG